MNHQPSLADDSHEMSRLFSEKIKVKLFSTAVVIGTLRVKEVICFTFLGIFFFFFFFSAAHLYIS